MKEELSWEGPAPEEEEEGERGKEYDSLEWEVTCKRLCEWEERYRGLFSSSSWMSSTNSSSASIGSLSLPPSFSSSNSSSDITMASTFTFTLYSSSLFPCTLPMTIRGSDLPSLVLREVPVSAPGLEWKSGLCCWSDTALWIRIWGRAC